MHDTVIKRGFLFRANEHSAQAAECVCGGWSQTAQEPNVASSSCDSLCCSVFFPAAVIPVTAGGQS